MIRAAKHVSWSQVSPVEFEVFWSSKIRCNINQTQKFTTGIMYFIGSNFFQNLQSPEQQAMKALLIALCFVAMITTFVSGRRLKVKTRGEATNHDACVLDCEDKRDKCHKKYENDSNIEKFVNCGVAYDTCIDDCKNEWLK